MSPHRCPAPHFTASHHTPMMLLSIFPWNDEPERFGPPERRSIIECSRRRSTPSPLHPRSPTLNRSALTDKENRALFFPVRERMKCFGDPSAELEKLAFERLSPKKVEQFAFYEDDLALTINRDPIAPVLHPLLELGQHSNSIRFRQRRPSQPVRHNVAFLHGAENDMHSRCERLHLIGLKHSFSDTDMVGNGNVDISSEQAIPPENVSVEVDGT